MLFVYKNMKYPAPEFMVIEGFVHHSDWATWKDVFKGCNELKFNLLLTFDSVASYVASPLHSLAVFSRRLVRNV